MKLYLFDGNCNANKYTGSRSHSLYISHIKNETFDLFVPGIFKSILINIFTKVGIFFMKTVFICIWAIEKN